MGKRKRYEKTLEQLECVDLLKGAEEWTPGEVRAMAQHEGVSPETWIVENLTTFPDIELRLRRFVDVIDECSHLLYYELREAYRIAYTFLHPQP